MFYNYNQGKIKMYYLVFNNQHIYYTSYKKKTKTNKTRRKQHLAYEVSVIHTKNMSLKILFSGV